MIARAMLAALLSAATVAGAAEPKPSGSPSTANYRPIGRDEQGLWAEADEAERELKTSKLVIREPQVNAYLRRVLCREVGGCRLRERAAVSAARAGQQRQHGAQWRAAGLFRLAAAYPRRGRTRRDPRP
ncbi:MULTISPECIES: hypothetical protein [unclassified Sphingomonas]|uniref:hypothetical protein n=1 Tax=unclassified Sphingomonas TaxID=196159 RepID=UPI00226ADA10|nr:MULTISPECIES: hypothetical protein [unclassified Sphingomonas]